MLEIDRILELLTIDRDWHSISELAEKTDIRVKNVEEITEFLAAHKFISLNDHGKRAKIERTTSLFLTRIHTEEKLSARYLKPISQTLEPRSRSMFHLP